MAAKETLFSEKQKKSSDFYKLCIILYKVQLVRQRYLSKLMPNIPKKSDIYNAAFLIYYDAKILLYRYWILCGDYPTMP